MNLQVAGFAIIHQIHRYHGSPLDQKYSYCHNMQRPKGRHRGGHLGKSEIVPGTPVSG